MPNFMDRLVCRGCNQARGSLDDFSALSPSVVRPSGLPEGHREQWQCPGDSSLNFMERPTCRRCNQPRPANPLTFVTIKGGGIVSAGPNSSAAGGAIGGIGGAPGQAPGGAGSEWMCGKCRMLNFAQRTTCRSCSAPRPPGAGTAVGSPGTQRPSMTGSGEPQVSDAAEGIQRLNKQLAEIDEEMERVKLRKSFMEARQASFVDPQELVDRIYAENQRRVQGLAPITEPQPIEPDKYELYQTEAARAKEMHDRVKAVLRRRKLLYYHRVRMTGVRMMTLVQHGKETPVYPEFGFPRLCLPSALFRMTSQVQTRSGPPPMPNTDRWDNNLAPEVDMDWHYEPITYVYDDQTQRVHDPYKEHETRREMLRWTDEEQAAFVEAYKDYGKEFHAVATKKPFRLSEVAPKTTQEIIAFYYHIKHRIGLKQLVSRRGTRMASSGENIAIPRELRDIGITTEQEFLAYLVAQNKDREEKMAEKRQREEASRNGDKPVSGEVKMELPSALRADLSGVKVESHQPSNWSELQWHILVESVREHGPKWSLLAKDTGKTVDEVRAAYAAEQAQLEKELMLERASGHDAGVAGEWVDDERLLLRQLIRKHGDDWDVVADGLKSKSGAQCQALFHRFRWRLGLQEALTEWESEQSGERPQKSAKHGNSGEDDSSSSSRRRALTETLDVQGRTVPVQSGSKGAKGGAAQPSNDSAADH